jgi:hypothetical protein
LLDTTVPERDRLERTQESLASVDLIALPPALAVLALVIGAALRFATLGQQSLDEDQAARIPLGRLEDVAPQMLLGEGRPFLHFFALAVGVLVVTPVALVLVRGGPAQRRAVLLPLVVGCIGVL